MRVWGKKTLLRKDRVKSWGYQNWKPPRWGRVWERRSASEGLLIYRELISFFFLIYFLIGGKFLYNVLLVSAIQEHKSVVIMHISPPS